MVHIVSQSCLFILVVPPSCSNQSARKTNPSRPRDARIRSHPFPSVHLSIHPSILRVSHLNENTPQDRHTSTAGALEPSFFLMNVCVNSQTQSSLGTGIHPRARRARGCTAARECTPKEGRAVARTRRASPGLRHAETNIKITKEKNIDRYVVVFASRRVASSGSVCWMVGWMCRHARTHSWMMDAA